MTSMAVGRRGVMAQPTASVFTPASIAGLQLWIDASQLTGLVDSDPVATWTDLSGSGHHPTQATSTKRPLYKTAIQNGRAGVRFDGVDDTLLASYTAGTTPTTFVVATYLAAYSANATVVDGAVGFKNVVYRSSSTQMSQYVGSGVAITTTPQSPHIYVSVLAATPTFAVDAGTPASNSTAGAETSGITVGSSAGGASPANADIFEVIQYSGTLSAPNRAQVLSYLKSKWGTP